MKLNLRVLSIAVMVASGMIGAVILASPAELGLSPVASRWLGIVGVGLALLQGVLPRVQGPTTDPETLADRVWDLPEEDREQVAHLLAQRAEHAREVSRE